MPGPDKSKVDMSQLTEGEIAQMFNHYDDLMSAMMESNNRLIRRLSACKGITAEHREILNSWSVANNAMQETSALMMERNASGAMN